MISPSSDPAVVALAARLKQARQDQGLSVRELCEAAGITSKSVAWRAENGRDVAFSIAAKLAAALGVSLDGTVN